MIAKQPTRAVPPPSLALWLFGVFFAAMLVAFWPSYFSRLGQQATYHAHAHGIAMILWCVMLLAQAGLVLTRAYRWHRLIGRLSFVLVPAIVLATLDFLHFRLAGAAQLGDGALYFIALIFNALVAFAVIYALAIRFRRNPGLHGRYMIATIFPLFTPITDRLIAVHWPAIAGYVPNIGGATVLPVVGFALADTILIGLVLWDWIRNRRLDAFAVSLGITVVYHLSVLTFHQVPAWRDFAYWLQALPL